MNGKTHADIVQELENQLDQGPLKGSVMVDALCSLLSIQDFCVLAESIESRLFQPGFPRQDSGHIARAILLEQQLASALEERAAAEIAHAQERSRYGILLMLLAPSMNGSFFHGSVVSTALGANL